MVPISIIGDVKYIWLKLHIKKSTLRKLNFQGHSSTTEESYWMISVHVINLNVPLTNHLQLDT
jgi:hypothetical protein